MVGIVIVSHSRRLAEGVRELAEPMGQGHVAIAIAAGIDDPENPLGTDPLQIQQAIASVYSDAGVIVLMDLGSALLSAEMALEFLAPEHRDRVRLCEAPLVEGAIAATVAAATGQGLEQVMAEARMSLVTKAAQLGVALPVPESLTSFAPTVAPTASSGPQPPKIRLTVQNPLGLHARPAAKFVATAAKFQAQVQARNLTRNTTFVRADSINQVATLGVRQGHELEVMAQGPEADAALTALSNLVNQQFGEIPSQVTEPTPASVASVTAKGTAELTGIPVAPGVAMGPVFHYRSVPLKIREHRVSDVQLEWLRLQAAVQLAQEDIQTLRSQTATQVGEAAAEIFDAHLLVLADPNLLETVQQQIFEQHLNAEAIWQAEIQALVKTYRALEDPYMQERASDVSDVGQRVLGFLSGVGMASLDLLQPSIVVATELTPSATAQLNPKQVLGLCTTLGSTTSHSAILARTLGIPAVVGVGPKVLHVAEGTVLALDGTTGQIWVQPDPETLIDLQARQHQRKNQPAIPAIAHQPTTTRDGRQINILANIGSLADAQAALDWGAEGVGLLRTEFLYLNRPTLPTEAEQLEVYQAIAQILGTRPLIIRTLDVGGDKSLPYLNLPPEPNPFLGCRGIRFCLTQPDLFKTQLRAILRASSGHSFKIMFPMVATIEELQAAKVLWGQVQQELRQARIAFDETIPIGAMIEIPSAVMLAEQLAQEVDFFSIGTNDLSQYVMAADRTHPQVAHLADALHPAVLQMIQRTIQVAHAVGIEVGLCGELAADPIATPVLIGLGLDKWSLTPQAIPTVKQAIAQFTLAEAEAIATEALTLKSAIAVRQVISAWQQPL